MEYHEHEKEYAGRGTTAAAIVGDALGGVGFAGVAAQFLKNLFGQRGGGSGDPAVLAAMLSALNQPSAPCGGYVTKFELEQQNKITEKDTEIAYLRGRDAAKTDTLETYAYINGELKDIRSTLAAQAVVNQKTEDAFALVGEKIGCLKNEFMAALCRERDDRVCGDNTIITYANATFYPKLVAGVTPTTETTPQTVYNPLQGRCGC